VSVLIRSQIDEFDEIASKAAADTVVDTAADTAADTVADTVTTDDQAVLSTPLSVVQDPEVHRSKVFVDGHVELRSHQPPATLLSFGYNIHQRLAAWLTAELTAFGVQLPDALVFSPEDNVSVSLY
jgi:hypothetical protein